MTDKRRQPPSARDTRFQKGKSGNPKGRPKKKHPISKEPDNPLSRLHAERFTVTGQDSEHKLSTKEFQEHKILEAALKGKLRAVRQVFRWIKKRRDIQHRKQTARRSPFLKAVLEQPDPRNADEALLLLDIICVNEDDEDRAGAEPQYFMMAWAVESALRRRRGAKRIDRETLSWILAYTRDAKSVKLPKGYKT